MLAKQRQQTIAQIVQNQGVSDVKYLASKLGITEKTVRLDLDKLQNQGILKRIRGGAEAVKNKNKSYFFSVSKYQEKLDEKKAIALKAKELIQEDDIIFLDDGSTTMELAKLLGDFHITVLTTDIEIIMELAQHDNIDLFAIGGKIRRTVGTYMTTGPETIRTISSVHINKCFLGTTGIDPDKGLTIFYEGNRTFKRALIENCDEVILLTDSGKFQKRAFSVYADASEMNYIITDNGISKENLNKLKKKSHVIVTRTPKKKPKNENV